ncbi:alpha-N-acetylgalactosaminidase-like [Uloborus diversus]|uniref:alpha-N-acetylgalactosaminidase-like n=1 Tax=Uloborus diversus TaxID=327109 RepID=UPI002409D214|nr:alpha-N-acetylgalactosaminidase-like [Uloborus diversus]
MLFLGFFLCVSPIFTRALDNGLALTPPMGWLSWERFTCNIDCDNDPKNCISEQLYMDMADRLVADGYKELGYEYVNIDDCWMERKRDSSNRLVPDHKRFPNGIKALADYVHSKGLKLGIYQDVGTNTCAGYPGSQGFYDIDASTFAEWEIDMLKVDGCYADPKDMDDMYPKYSIAVNKTSRPILFSCEWPLYQQQTGIKPNYKEIAKYCNIWRNDHDIDDSWSNVLDVIDYYAANQDELAAVAGPGHWNDPDMILAGNFGLSYEEAKAQLMLWSIFASPLLMSNDLRNIEKQFSDLLKNKEIIAVNQDPLGKMGKRIKKINNVEIWVRPISPVVGSKYSFAVVAFNRNTLGGPQNVSVQLSSIGLDSASCYIIYDSATPEKKTKLCPKDNIVIKVNPSGATMTIAKLNKNFFFKH